MTDAQCLAIIAAIFLTEKAATDDSATNIRLAVRAAKLVVQEARAQSGGQR